MRTSPAVRLLAITLCTFTASSLSAQYRGSVTITGGTHAGSYEMKRPSCSIDGASQVALIDTSSMAAKETLTALIVNHSAFTLGFGAGAERAATQVNFSKANASRISGAGSLKLTYVYGNETFTAQLTGTTVEGTDTVRVKATIGCKGVKRLVRADG